MGSYSSVLSVTTSSREITSKIFFSLKKIRKMSPTNQTFGWGSNSNTNNSNGFGGGYQTNTINGTFNNNNNSTNSSFNNNNNTCSGGVQQLPNLLAPLTPNITRTEPEPRTELQDYSVPM